MQNKQNFTFKFFNWLGRLIWTVREDKLTTLQDWADRRASLNYVEPDAELDQVKVAAMIVGAAHYVGKRDAAE